MQKGRKGYEEMNPVLIFLILLCAFILWMILSMAYYKIGNIIFKIGKHVHNEIDREEKNENNEERGKIDEER